MNDIREVTAAIKLLFASYPNFNGTQETVAAYVAALSVVQIENIRRGVARAISSKREFCPPAGVLLDLCSDEIDGLPDVDAAWAELSKQISCVGWCGIPKFSHPVIEATVKGMGRWADICATEIDQLGVLRGQFARMYESAKARHENECKQASVKSLTTFMESGRAQLDGSVQGEIKRIAQQRRIA